MKPSLLWFLTTLPFAAVGQPANNKSVEWQASEFFFKNIYPKYPALAKIRYSARVENESGYFSFSPCFSVGFAKSLYASKDSARLGELLYNPGIRQLKKYSRKFLSLGVYAALKSDSVTVVPIAVSYNYQHDVYYLQYNLKGSFIKYCKSSEIE